MDIVIVEIGGTVGDIESLPFLEAIRQFRQDVGRDQTLYIHLTLVPWIGTAGELKTKPTQHSVRDLRSIGIQPDILLCRTDRVLPRDVKQKIALFCDVDEEAVITARDVDTIYEVPLALAEEGIDRIILKLLQLPPTERRMERWEQLVDSIRHPKDELTIHVVGKYVGYEDSYKSLNEALYHGGFGHGVKVNIHWVEAEALEEPGGERLLDGAHGILVPGGFGNRGTRGMMRAAEVARSRGDPLLRHLLRLPVGGGRVRAQRLRADRSRLDRVRAGHAAQGDLQAARPARRGRSRRHDAARIVRVRAAARLARPPHLRRRRPSTSGTVTGTSSTACTRSALTEKGLLISGRSPDGKFVEIVELPGHPWYIAVQFHPEFKSKPLAPHPLFASFVAASYQQKLARTLATHRRRLDPAA